MNARPAGTTLNWRQLPVRAGLTANRSISSFILFTRLRDPVIQYIRPSFPGEGAGVLATCGTGSSLIANCFYPGRNADSSSRRYTMDPADVFAARAAMEREKTWLGAIAHAHPNSSPIPLRTNVVEATFPGVLSVIVGHSPTVDFRAWGLDYDEHCVAV